MKHLKTKLMAAVAMLLVATVMLTSASFAWFTISTAPEITDMTTTVETNENLEIALAKTRTDNTPKATEIPAAAAVGDSYAATKTANDQAYTWGNIVDLSFNKTTDVASKAFNELDKTIRPGTLVASGTDAGKFKYPQYGTDGRVKALSAMEADTGNANGFGNLKDADGNIYGYYVDFWMRSNVGGNVTLATAKDRAASKDGTGNNGWTGTGSTFKATSGSATQKETIADNMAVAFKVLYDENGTVSTNATAKAMTNTLNTDKASAAFTGTVATLTANKAVYVRMYVYLEGEDVTNAAASIDGTLLTGSLDIQFEITGTGDAAVDNAMKVDGVSYS